MPTKFIHLSDLHIHGSNKRRDNRNCRKVVKFILNHYSNENPIILITGDITDDGKERQYKNAVDILRPLTEAGLSVLAVPGNHDYGLFGNFYSEEAKRFFRDYIMYDLMGIASAKDAYFEMEDLYPMVTYVKDVLFIGLDSVVGNEDELLHFASGEVGKVQRDKLVNILKSKSDQKVVMYFHHHPFCNSATKFVMEMDDAKQVLRILSGLVDFVCFGHKHESAVWVAENNIDWMMSAGKTPRRNLQYKFQFREVIIDSDDNQVSMITFAG